MNEIIEYYNHFNEEKRLLSRHGQVEYIVSMHYIHECLNHFENPKILDIGAGTGRYSCALANEKYDTTAVELCKPNLGVLKAKKSGCKAYLGNALDLSLFDDNTYDVTLLFGPMYHLFNDEDKVKALKEALRVTKIGGYVLVAYCMNDYSIITYGFKEHHILECMANGTINDDFHTVSSTNNLYDYVRIEDIDRINKLANASRVKIVAVDGHANFMRPTLKEMDDETFNYLIKYQLHVAERMDMIGASSHTVDILIKQ